MSYLISRLMSLMSEILIIVLTTLIALTGHELAHGWVSSKLGDPTPKAEGRLTLNPLKHLDPLGTLLMLLTGFGWAKPVSVNPMYYKDRKKGMALVAVAGPLANLIMAALAIVLGMLCIRLAVDNSFDPSLILAVVRIFVFRNLCFLVFNLIPIPPLDGAKVLGMFLPNRTYYTMLQYEQYAIFLIMILSLTGAFDRIIGTGVNAVWNMLQNLAFAIVF